MNDLPASSQWDMARLSSEPACGTNRTSEPKLNRAVVLVCLSLALIAILLPWLALALQTYGLSPAGSTDLGRLGFLLLMYTVLAVPTVIGVGIVLLCYRRHRILGLVLIVSGLLGGVSLPLSRSAYHDLRREKFTALAERSMPLVEAIKRYESVNGAPPQKLESLVPKYIAAVPGTGIGMYPEFSYDSKPVPQDRNYPWILYVNVGLGFLNWDRFLYLPGEQYPKEGWGGWLEPMGRWAYVHE